MMMIQKTATFLIFLTSKNRLTLLLIFGRLTLGDADLRSAPTSLTSFLVPIRRPTGRHQLSVWQRTRTLVSGTPSWSELEICFGEAYKTQGPSVIDSVLQPDKPHFSTHHPTLFRERHGWCPYSERVWLTLELLNTPYDTIRIDNTGGGKPSYYSGLTPQLKWPDGKMQGESLDLMRDLEHHYGAGTDDLSLGFSNPQVQNYISQFRSTFPSRARPSSRAAFLFQGSGDPLWKSVFEETLQKTDQLLSESSNSGPFFCGDTISAADVAWAPFLERYRYQLPCLHRGLDPNDSEVYPHLALWYEAMDTTIPAYACRVKGDAASWRKVLTMAGFGNSGVPPEITANIQERVEEEMKIADRTINNGLWKEYASTRPYLAETCQAEAAMIMTKNKDAIIKDALKRYDDATWNQKGLPITEADLSSSLRALVCVLLDETDARAREIPGVGPMAKFLDARMCVPRDMGAMSAASIKKLAFELP